MTTLDVRQAVGRSIHVCAATAPGAAAAGAEVVGVTGWVLHGDGRAALAVTAPVTPQHPGLVALVHATGDAERDRAAHLVLRSLTRKRDGSWNAGTMAEAFHQAHAVLTESVTTARVSGALLAVLADGQVLASGLGDVRIYRVIDGYAVLLTTAPAQSGPQADSSTWLGGPMFQSPASYAVPSQPGDRLLICTRGLHANVRSDQIATLAAGDPRDAVQELVRAAAARDPRILATAVLINRPQAPSSSAARRP